MIELRPVINDALIKIDFISRYENLSKLFDSVKTPSNSRLRFIDGELVIESINQLGYVVDFEPKDKFFKIKDENINNYSFSINIILDGGMVDIVWIVRERDKILLGIPISEFSRLMINPSYRIKKPVFGSYEDLDEIFEITFKMYEDFKKAVTEK